MRMLSTAHPLGSRCDIRPALPSGAPTRGRPLVSRGTLAGSCLAAMTLPRGRSPAQRALGQIVGI